MAVKIPPIDVDDLCKRYLAGETVKELASALGVSQATVYTRLRARGVVRSAKEAAKTAKYATAPWADEAIKLHLAGITQAEIGRRVGVTQSSVSSVLLRRGYRTDPADATRRHWESMTPEERAAQVADAHDAVRGMVRTEDDLERRARGKQRTQAHATGEERAIARLLRSMGETVVLQQAVGKYNLDLGVGDAVAVELMGGGWHMYGRHGARLTKRTMDIADRGWNMHLIWSVYKAHVVPAVVADDIHTFAERTRRDPAFRRQYRVVRGDGELIAAGSLDDDDVTLIPAGIRGIYTGGSFDED
ncbi:MAG: hypothetical protein L0K65_06890 [Actinomyces sp.]|nr:hypothetical protein [Actinomyces sp.]